MIAGVAAAGLAAVLSSHPVRSQSQPFAPEVDDSSGFTSRAAATSSPTGCRATGRRRRTTTRRAFKPIDGLTMDLVASEPVIRQPVDLHFDDRGRLWVVQYLHTRFPPASPSPRTTSTCARVTTRVPAAPPHHVRGADKITVLEDTNGDGTFDSHKDVITGLNITTSVLTGHGGVWVMNPPYLLFYRDSTGDGLPDGDPEVRLSGFGLEDTHSLANSLTWGPDGWLYGVHGSTSTARVRGISFLGQAVWRYHPDTDAFELFAQGGGIPGRSPSTAGAARSRAITAATAADFTGCRADATRRTGRSTVRSPDRTPTASSRTWIIRAMKRGSR